MVFLFLFLIVFCDIFSFVPFFLNLFKIFAGTICFDVFVLTEFLVIVLIDIVIGLIILII